MGEYQVLLEQARIQLGQQEATLDLLRTRATAVLSIAGVVAALFAPHYLRKGDSWAYWAAAALVLTVLVAVLIIRPAMWATGAHLGAYQEWLTKSREWRKENDPDGPDLTDSLTEELAAVLVVAYSQNGEKYRKLSWCYQAECLLLVVQVILWMVAVIPR